MSGKYGKCGKSGKNKTGKVSRMSRPVIHHLHLAILTVIAIIILTSCSHIKVERPEGFADFKARNLYRAVSPEGMLFGVRTADNYPKMDIDFWAAALKNHLLKEGYRITLDKESFTAATGQGVLYEWGVPYANESYIYMTAIIISGNRIAIIEAGGEHTVYKTHREAVLNSITTLKIR